MSLSWNRCWAESWPHPPDGALSHAPKKPGQPGFFVCADLASVREGFAFGDGIEGFAGAGGVEQRSQGVGLTAAERRNELEDPVARAAGEAGEHVL